MLNRFMPLISFYSPRKHQKTSSFLMFSGCRTSGMKWDKELEKQDGIVGAFAEDV